MAVKKYTKGAEKQLSENFNQKEFDCNCSCKNPTLIDTELVKWLAAEYRIKVCYTKLFNPFIRCLKIGLVSKVFGDYVYKD